ncbi:MAG TPA: V-type ATP synthase subunit F [bacterium]
MKTCRVIADQDSAVGFRLAGLDAVAVATAQEAERELRAQIDAGECSLIIVAQRFLDGFSETMRRRLERLSVPIVIPLPLSAAWQREEMTQEYVQSLIRRAIGFQMRITRQEGGRP